MKWVLLSHLSATFFWTVWHCKWIHLRKWIWFWPYDLLDHVKRTDLQTIHINLQWHLSLPLLPSSCCFESVNREQRYRLNCQAFGLLVLSQAQQAQQSLTPRSRCILSCTWIGCEWNLDLGGAPCWQSPGVTIKQLSGWCPSWLSFKREVSRAFELKMNTLLSFAGGKPILQ